METMPLKSLIFETFTIFIKMDTGLTILLGVRTTQKKYAIISNHKFNTNDLDSLDKFLGVAAKSTFVLSEALLGDFDDLEWFDNKNAAVNEYRMRFRGWID